MSVNVYDGTSLKRIAGAGESNIGFTGTKAEWNAVTDKTAYAGKVISITDDYEADAGRLVKSVKEDEFSVSNAGQLALDSQISNKLSTVDALDEKIDANIENGFIQSKNLFRILSDCYLQGSNGNLSLRTGDGGYSFVAKVQRNTDYHIKSFVVGNRFRVAGFMNEPTFSTDNISRGNDGTQLVWESDTITQEYQLNSNEYNYIVLTVSNNASSIVGKAQLEKGTSASDFEKYSSKSNEELTEELSALETYSTTEQAIGTWIDGKTIYRKVVTFASTITMASNSWTSTGISSSGIGRILRVDGLENSEYKVTMPLCGNINNGLINVLCARTSSALLNSIIIEYIKS